MALKIDDDYVNLFPPNKRDIIKTTLENINDEMKTSLKCVDKERNRLRYELSWQHIREESIFNKFAESCDDIIIFLVAVHYETFKLFRNIKWLRNFINSNAKLLSGNKTEMKFTDDDDLIQIFKNARANIKTLKKLLYLRFCFFKTKTYNEYDAMSINYAIADIFISFNKYNDKTPKINKTLRNSKKRKQRNISTNNLRQKSSRKKIKKKKNNRSIQENKIIDNKYLSDEDDDIMDLSQCNLSSHNQLRQNNNDNEFLKMKCFTPLPSINLARSTFPIKTDNNQEINDFQKAIELSSKSYKYEQEARRQSLIETNSNMDPMQKEWDKIIEISKRSYAKEQEARKNNNYFNDKYINDFDYHQEEEEEEEEEYTNMRDGLLTGGSSNIFGNHSILFDHYTSNTHTNTNTNTNINTNIIDINNDIDNNEAKDTEEVDQLFVNSYMHRNDVSKQTRKRKQATMYDETPLKRQRISRGPSGTYGHNDFVQINESFDNFYINNNDNNNNNINFCVDLNFISTKRKFKENKYKHYKLYSNEKQNKNVKKRRRRSSL